MDASLLEVLSRTLLHIKDLLGLLLLLAVCDLFVLSQSMIPVAEGITFLVSPGARLITGLICHHV